MLWSQQSAMAIDLGSNKLRLNGFGSLAMTYSGNENLFFPYYLTKDEMDEAGTYFDESLLGLQLDATLTRSLEATAQVVVRNREDESLENYLERASIKYSEGNLLVRAGRIGLNLYSLSEFRDVGFAYTWAHPSMEFYGPFGMDYFDGAEVAYNFQLPKGTLHTSLYGGSLNQKFGGNAELDYTNMFGGTLAWNINSWMLRGGIFRASIDGDLSNFESIRNGLEAVDTLSTSLGVDVWPEASSLIEDFVIDDTSITYASVGLSYDAHPWQIESELSYTALEAGVLPNFYGGYVSTGYTFNAFTIFGMAGFIEPADERKIASDVETLPAAYASYQDTLDALQEQVQSAYNNLVNQNSLSLGARWDVRQNIAIKVQWDHTWVDEFGSHLWYREGDNEEDVEVDTVSLKLDFVF
jgi:outer membrane murein-binding lipoprotein Lpp